VIVESWQLSQVRDPFTRHVTGWLLKANGAEFLITHQQAMAIAAGAGVVSMRGSQPRYSPLHARPLTPAELHGDSRLPS
jgi:hypothetical protein